MTNKIIGAVVAGIIIMAWQTASHTFLQMHAVQEQYTPNQDAILKVLSENLDKQGQYYLPNVPPGTSMEDMGKAMEQAMGKPYASILYSPKNETSMTSNLLRGLGNNILLGFILAWMMRKLKVQTLRNIVTASMLVGWMAFCFFPYPAFIWYEVPGIWIELSDSVAAFTLAGLWLGWWMTRKKA
jgi:hypothetical protein